MSIAKNIKNGLLVGASLNSYKSNAPKQYKDRNKRYYEDENSSFIAQYAKYSNDFVDADVQGTNSEDFYKYVSVKMRLAELVRASASMQRTFDNYKNIMIATPGIDYLPLGAKVKTMGNTWLSVNPQNMSGSSGQGVIQRCDAVWRFYDYYGNIIEEPMCVDDISMNANDNDSQRSTMITKGYFAVKCQYNENTKQLDNNSRLIFGRSAYRITGFSDFNMEFTGDYNSVHMIAFNVRYEEPNYAIDDMNERIAGGKTFAWDIEISGNPVVKEGEKVTLTAVSKRTFGGEKKVVESTDEHPINYHWRSSDPSVASVNPYGAVTGVSEGRAIITAYLEQNPLKTQEFEIEVESVNAEPHVEFTVTAPSCIKAYRSETLRAAFFEDGSETGEEIEWELSGADEKAYSYEINDDNSITIKCWRGSVEKLMVDAIYGEYHTTTYIELEGI